MNLPPDPSEDILVLHRWYHDGVPVVRIRFGAGGELPAVAGESAVLAVVTRWLRGESPGLTSGDRP